MINLKAKEIALGYEHTIAIDFDGNVWGWGDPASGRLGLDSDGAFIETPTLIPGLKGKSLAAASFSSAIIDPENNVWVFGHGETGEDVWEPTQIYNFKAKKSLLGNRFG